MCILFKNVKVQVKLGFCFAALKVIPFTPIFSPHPNHLPCHFHLISLPKISKSLNPTSYETPTKYDYVMVYVS